MASSVQQYEISFNIIYSSAILIFQPCIHQVMQSLRPKLHDKEKHASWASDEVLWLLLKRCNLVVHCNHLYKLTALWKALRSSLSKDALPTVINPSGNAPRSQLQADNVVPLICIHSGKCWLTSLNKSCRTDKDF